jgi:DNA gyrase/topoisomerase IV subunit A
MPEADHQMRRQRMQESISLAEALVAVAEDPRKFFDAVVDAPDTPAAIAGLMDLYGFSDLEARVALDLQVRRFSAEERNRLREHPQTLARELEALDAID